MERRGYKKCPLCWRHIVKIEEHIAAHEAGLIGSDGKRTDRSDAQRRRWAERYNGTAASLQRRSARATSVPRSQYRHLLELAPVDLRKLRAELDAASDPEP
jgi:hypothetical protein